MKITYEQRLNRSNNLSFTASYYAAELDSIGGEPLAGSGFENETPEPDFEEGQ